jgi:hypothetical protein
MAVETAPPPAPAERRPRRRRRRDLAGYGREALPPLITPGQAQAAQTLNEAMRSLLSAGGGAYLKVFRTHPLPPTFQGQLYQIDTVRALDGIRDHAEHIRQLGLASGWASGTFEVHGWIEGGTEPQFRLPLAFEFPAAPGTGRADVSVAAPAPSPAEQIKQVGELVSAVKTVTGESANADTLARMFTAGLEVAKSHTPANPMSGALETLVTRLVERLLAPPPAPAEDATQRALQLLERLGYTRAPAAAAGSPVDQLVQSVATAKNLVDAVGALSPGAAAAAPARVSGWTAWAQTFQAIAPIIGTAVSQITGTVNNVVEARKFEHLARANAARHVSPGSATPAAAASPLAGFEHAISEGIHTPEVFQAVSTAIARAGHSGLLEAVRGGQVSAAQILEQAGAAIPELSLPGGPEFIHAYVAWLQTASAPSSVAAEDTITVQCTKCGAKGPLPRRTPLSSVYCTTPTAGPNGTQTPCGAPVVQVPG